MKKILVKAEIVTQAYQAPVEGYPECWVKELETGIGEVLYERPKLEDGSVDESYIYHPAIEAQPEVPEVKEWKVIAQTQGTDKELAVWLEGDKHKYPDGYQVEYIDITAQIEQEKINAEALKYLADTDWMVVREVETQVPCPVEVKAKRAEARLKIVK